MALVRWRVHDDELELQCRESGRAASVSNPTLDGEWLELVSVGWRRGVGNRRRVLRGAASVRSRSVSQAAATRPLIGQRTNPRRLSRPAGVSRAPLECPRFELAVRREAPDPA